MKILYKAITADTQVTTQSCYFVGASSGFEVEHLKIYDEASSSATAAQMVCDLGAEDCFTIPMPGVKCDNGLYAEIDHGTAVVYYYY